MEAEDAAPLPGPDSALDGPAGLLTRLADDDTTQRRAAVLCLFGFVAAVAAGGACWHHLPAVLGCWCAAGGLLLAAFVLGWEPTAPPETTVTYYDGALPVPAADRAPQPMRQPAPWDRRVG